MDEEVFDETGSREYRWYLRGCRKLNWPLQFGPTEFIVQYRRYRRCTEAIERYESRRIRHMRRRGGTGYRDDVFLERLMQSIHLEQARLEYLATAVSAGQGDDAGGAGMPAYRRPNMPILVGAGAKLPPHLDPEPWARDP